MPIKEPTPHALPIVLTVSAGVPPADYATGDEGMLGRPEIGVRVAILTERCVTYGVGVDPRSAFLRRAATERIPTVPRRSGGTGLLHEAGDLAWTVALPRRDPRVGGDFTRAYARLGRGVVRWLEGHRLDARWSAPPGLVPEYCTLGPRGWVLSARDRILGGAAQHVVREALLHHGTISVSVDRPTIDRLFDLPPPSPTERLAGLKDLGLAGTFPSLAEELAATIARELGSG